MSDFESFSDESERLFDRTVDKKERLIQTYIVVSGLLVACYQQPSNLNINAFYISVVTLITYYVELSKLKLSNVTTSVHRLVYLNVLGMFTAATFAYLIVDFLKDFYSDSSLYFGGFFLTMTITVARSLWLNYPEFTPRKTDKTGK